MCSADEQVGMVHADTAAQASNYTVITAHRAGVAIKDIAAASGLSSEQIAAILCSEPAEFPWNTAPSLVGR